MMKKFTGLMSTLILMASMIVFTTTGLFAQYCSSQSSDLTFEWISNVNFAGIDNSSGSTYYSDFTNISANVSPGGTYSFSATISQTGSDPELVTVYIDWDQSQTFEASERYDIGQCNSNGCVITSDIEVPGSALPGETRMRVLHTYSTAPASACASFTYGEVEDYSVIVNTGVCTPPSFTYSIVNNCANDTYKVMATLTDFNDNSFVTVYLTRSDAVPVNNVTLISALEGQTVPVISNIPFGVTIDAVISMGNPVCNQNRHWQENICPAENDEPCDAIALECGDMLQNQTFIGATQSMTDACFGNQSRDIWYSFVADGSQHYVVEALNTDVVVSLYTSNDCNELTQVGTCQDFPESFDVTEAGTYYFKVRPYFDNDDFVDISLNCLPFDCPDLLADVGSPCDDGNPNTYVDVLQEDCSCAGFVPVPGQICEVPIGISSLPYASTGNTSTYIDDYSFTSANFPPLLPGALTSGTNPSFYMGGDEVVYSYTSPSTESLNITVTNHGTYAGVFVFTGCPFAATAAYTTNSSGTLPLKIDGLITEPGQTYYIVISTWPSPQSTSYALNIQSVAFDCPALEANFGSPCDDGDAGTTDDVINENCECAGIPIPPNDEVCNATELVCNETLENQVMLGASPSVVDNCYLPQNGDIWYKFTTTPGTSYTIDLEGGGPNSTALTSALYIGDDCNNLEEVLGCYTFSIGYIFGEADTAETYYMRVRPYSNAETVTVTLQCANTPDNGTCDTAEPVSCFGTYTGSTLGAPDFDPGQSFCGISSFYFPDNTNGGTWYSYTPDVDMETTFDLSGSSFNTTLFLYSGECGSLTCLAGDYDSGDGLTSKLEYDMTAGVTYYILVSGFGNNRGAYTMNVSCTNPACSPDITSVTAVTQSGDPLSCINSGDSYYLEVGIIGGSDTGYNLSVDGGTPVSISPNGTAIVGPVSGSNPEIYVSGVTDQTCNDSESFEPVFCPPVNDDPCGAISIACGQTVTAEFTGATESMDNDCFGSSEADVWFKFVADGTQNYFIEETTNFDAVMKLYKGDDCGNLIAVSDCEDFDEFFETGLAGTYYLMIRPYFDSDENLSATLSLTCSEFDCPGVGNYGAPCDDGNPNTVDDTVNGNCECVGVPQISNDEACGATLINCGDTIQQSFVGASASLDDDCFGSSSKDVWIKFISDGTQVYTISQLGGAPDYFDGVVQLYQGDDCGNLDEISDCKDYPESFQVFEAGTYYFRIRPYGSYAEGDMANITLACTPFDCPDLNTNIGTPCDDGDPNTVEDAVNANCECAGIPIATNDEPCTATAIACGDTILQSTAGATQTMDPVTCGPWTAAQAMDVWFSFTADGVSEYTVKNISSDDLVIEAFSSNGCSNLTASIGCGDIPEEIELGILDAGEYFVRAYAYSDFDPPYTVEMVLECVNNSAASLDGTLNWNSNCGERAGTVKLYQPNTANLVATYSITVAADGSFSIPSVEVGTFDVIVKVNGYLAKGVQDVVLSSGANALALGAIVGGDVNGDNFVSIIDASFVNNSFGSATGGTNYNPLTDLDCNGFVNIVDFSLLNASFGQAGATAPLN